MSSSFLLIFFNFFLDSKINEFSLEKKKGLFYLKSKNKKFISSAIKKETNIFFKHLNQKLNEGIFFLRNLFIPKIGEDKHYFGIKFLGKVIEINK